MLFAGLAGAVVGWACRGRDEEPSLEPDGVERHARIVASTTDYGDIPARISLAIDNAGKTTPPDDADQGMAQVVTPDEEWLKLLRTQFSFVDEFLRVRERVDCDSLFRNSSLNAADTWIQPALRQRLKVVVDDRRLLIKGLRRLGGELGIRELDALIAAGLARSRTYQEYLESLPEDQRADLLRRLSHAREQARIRWREVGLSDDVINAELAQLQAYGDDMFDFHPAMRVRRGGTHYGAERGELPAYDGNLALIESELVRLAGDVLAWFVENQVLSSESRSEFLARIQSALTEHDK